MTPFPFSTSTRLLRMENSICFRCYSLEEIQDWDIYFEKKALFFYLLLLYLSVSNTGFKID